MLTWLHADTAFEELPPKSVAKVRKELRLVFAPEQKERGNSKGNANAQEKELDGSGLRRLSRTSTSSTITSSAPHSLSSHGLKYLKIVFNTEEDRRDFLDIWQKFRTAT